MKNLLPIVSYLALGATLLPAILFCAGRLDLPAVHGIMLAATVVWFATTPFWMGRKAK